MNVKKELKGNLTEEQLNLLKKEVSASLSRDRHSLLISQPFVGNIAMRFDLIPVRDKRCRTACTDSKTIYFDCDFYSKLNDQERKFVLAHEIWHSLTLTFARRQGRDHDLFNVASDMEINNILVNDSKETGYFEPPSDLMYPPPHLKGKSAETIYEWLLKQQQKNNLNNALAGIPKPSSGDSDNNSDNQNNSDSSKSSKNKKSNSNNQDNEKRDDSSDGRNTGKLSGQFDKHSYNDEDPTEDDIDNNNSKSNSNGPTDQWGEVGYDEDFRPNVPADAAERMREAAIAAAQSYMREHGNLPAGVEGLVGKLTKPEISWREYLSQFVSQSYGGKRQYLPPARRHLYNDLYFQSRRNERIKGIVCIDTSGSCIGDLPKFFGELKGLIDTFGSYELTVIQADAAVDHVEVYDDANNPLELEVVSDIQYFGGGGTDYGPCFKYVEEYHLDPDFLIYIGDGYAEMSYDKQPKYPVMWLITKDGSFDFCDWGKKIRFKESSWD
jgi:predicted metal-dependent peptidase